MRFGSRFLKKVSQGAPFFVVHTWHQKAQQGTQKISRRVRNLGVRDLRSEAKGSRFEFGS